MKVYPNYKSSNIEWLGEVPSHWKIVPGRYCAEFTYGFPADSSKFTVERKGIPLIRIRDIYYQDTEVYYEGDDYPQSCLIRPDDILIGMDGDFNVSRWQGAHALLNQRVCKFQHSRQLIDGYVYYYLSLALKIVNNTKYATTVKHLSAQDLSDMRFLIPSLSEQEKIAAYLDDKTKKIDALIAEKQTQIDELRKYRTSLITETVTHGLNPNVTLRTSGIDWVGEIPSHWKIVSGRYCAEFTYGFPADSSKFTVERNGIPLIRIRDIYNQDTEVYYEGDDYPQSCLISPDDILIGMDGDFNVSRWQGAQALLNQRVCKFLYSRQLIEGYVYHYLSLALKIVNDTKYATTVKHLSAQDLSDMRFLIPPLSEQEAIAVYLDEKTKKIDAAIAELEIQIRDLGEYKKAVITEAVTGKVDVREWKHKENAEYVEA